MKSGVNLTDYVKDGNKFIIRGNQVKQVLHKRPSLGDLSLLPNREYKGLVGKSMGGVSVTIRNKRIQKIKHPVVLNKNSIEYKGIMVLGSALCERNAMQGLQELSKSNAL